MHLQYLDIFHVDLCIHCVVMHKTTVYYLS